MPSFRPPLSHTSQVSAPAQGDKPVHLKLDFYLTFESHEDTAGTWELWTDIPSLNSSGQLISPHEPWHAIAFTPITSSTSQSTTSESSTSTIALSSPAVEKPDSGLKIYRARALVTPTLGASFAYTYRRVHPDGGVEWLGGEGSNGVIKIMEGEQRGDDEHVKVSRKGYGLVLEQEGRFSPRVISLPSSSPAEIHLALLSTRQTSHLGPFASVIELLDADADSATGTSVFTILTRSNFHSFDVDQLIGVEDVLRLTGGSPNLAIDAVLPGVPAFATQCRRADIEVQPPNEQDNITAFFLGIGRNARLVVWAGASDSVRSVTVKPHLESLDKPQIVFDVEDKPTFVPASESKISLRIAPGDAVVHALHTLELDQLAITGGETLWIGAQDATSVQAGEEKQVESEMADMLEDDVTEGDRDEVMSTSRTEGVPELDTSDTVENAQTPAQTVDATPRAQPIESSDTQTTAPVKKPSPGLLSVLFKLISHLVAGVWGIFFPRQPQRAQPNSASQSATHSQELAAEHERTPTGTTAASVADDEVDVSEAQTPIDERTPLLRTPEIRRMGSSTETMSPTTPPAPKLYDTFPSLDRLTSLIHDKEPKKPSLQYTFDTAPPAKFVFPPGPGEILSRLSFQWRNKGSPWAPAAASEGEIGAGIKQVEVGVVGEVGAEWEVRVEGK